jgi:hypothetical protein
MDEWTWSIAEFLSAGGSTGPSWDNWGANSPDGPSWGANSDDPSWGASSDDPSWGGGSEDPSWGASSDDPSWGASSDDPSWGAASGDPSWGSAGRPSGSFSYPVSGNVYEVKFTISVMYIHRFNLGLSSLAATLLACTRMSARAS